MVGSSKNAIYNKTRKTENKNENHDCFNVTFKFD